MDYLNIWNYKDDKYPFQFFISGRGYGKTYSALKGLPDGKVSDKLLFMRRTKQELDLITDVNGKEGANPFKKLNKNEGTNLGFVKTKDGLSTIYEREMVDDKLQPKGLPLGYGVALSTISSLRGIDFSDCSDWVYDEFIPEVHVSKMRGEGDALLNAYETVNRNRELEGEKPISFFALGNSNNLNVPIFQSLGIVTDLERMLRKGKQEKLYPDRGLAVHIFGDSSDFTQKKSQTALYRLTKGTKFSEMSLKNKFAFDDFSLVEYKNIKGYSPICSLYDFTIWQDKEGLSLYCSYASGTCKYYNMDTLQGRRSFKSEIAPNLQGMFIKGYIKFESYDIKLKIVEQLFS